MRDLIPYYITMIVVMIVVMMLVLIIFKVNRRDGNE